MEFSRRSLIIGAGAAGAALSLGGPVLQAWAAEPPTPRPLESDLDLATVTIVAPDVAEWQAVAETLAGHIAAATGGAAPAIVTPEQQRFSDGWAGHVIQLGQLGNNIEIGRLYGMRFAMVDSWFPGVAADGSFWIRTLINPFGLGGNTLVVAASDLAGATAAVAALQPELTAATLPYQHRVKISDELRDSLYAGGRADEAYVAAKTKEFNADLAALKPVPDNETEAKKLHAVLHDIKLMGEAHLFTAEPGFAALLRLLVLGYTDYVNTNTDVAINQLGNNRNMWTEGEEVISIWASSEQEFDDTERSAVLQALVITYTANFDDGYLQGADPSAPRWNHEIFPAMSIVAAADYFQRHHELPEANEWREVGDMIFHGNTSLISWDDGSDYMMHLPIAIMDYAMFTGQYEFLSGVLRPAADLNSLMIDNAGSIAGGGDVYPYGYSGPYSWGHSQVMNAANWLFPEPIYGLLMERARTGPFSNNRASDLALPIHRFTVDPPEDSDDPEFTLPTVMAYPIDKGVYDTVVEETPSSIELGRTFNKMAFRAGLGIDDPTLMMDGFSGGRHNHQDGNTVIGYTARQRIMLADRDYMENTPEHHTGLVVVRDGEQVARPELTQIDWVADVDGAAFSRSTVRDWDDMEWTRTVVTTDGAFHVVWDELAVGTAGSYLVKNQWQSLGIGAVEGARYSCDQQGATMIIDSLDDSLLQTHDRYGHFQKNYKSTFLGEANWYKFAEAETVLSQVRPERAHKAGDRVSYVNVVATGDEGGPDITSRRADERMWQVTSAGEDWWFVTGELTGLLTAPDAVLSMFGPDRLSVAGVTELTIKGKAHSFAEPAIWFLDRSTGHWSAYPVRRDHVHYDEVGEPVRPGPLAEGDVEWTDADTNAVLNPIRKGRPWRPGKRTLPQVTAAPSGWESVGSVAARVSHVAEIAATEAGNDGLVLVGGIDGTVTAIGADGVEQWTVAAGGRVNEITHHTHDGDELITIATESYQLLAVGRDGKQRWVCQIPDEPARLECKGNLIGLTNVRLGHVNGHDKAPWLMVGTQYRWVYGLDWSGKIQHEMMCYYYGIQDAAYGDLDGDGKDEGAIALEYFYPSVWDDGAERRAGSAGGPGFTNVELYQSDDAAPLIIYGTKQNVVRTYTYADGGKPVQQWVTNVGGEVHDLHCGRFHDDVGDEIIVGTSGFHAWSLGVDGTPRFRASIGDRVLQVRAVAGDGYLAVADHGLVVGLDTAGSETGRWRFPDLVAGAAVTAGDAPLVVLNDGTVLQRAN